MTSAAKPAHEWIALDAELSDLKATHGMYVHGHTLLRLRPYVGYAYDRDPLTGNAKALSETRHVITPLVLVGQMSSSASEPWKTADGTRAWSGHSLEKATDDLIQCAARFKEQGSGPDRRISKATLLSWALPEGKVVDTTPREFDDENEGRQSAQTPKNETRASRSRPR